jgi:hypothetical protein
MGLAQRGDCGQRVQNVTHGSQADDKQAELGLGLQTLIFSQGNTGQGGSQPQPGQQPIHGGVFNSDAQADRLQGQIRW